MSIVPYIVFDYSTILYSISKQGPHHAAAHLTWLADPCPQSSSSQASYMYLPCHSEAMEVIGASFAARHVRRTTYTASLSLCAWQGSGVATAVSSPRLAAANGFAGSLPSRRCPLCRRGRQESDPHIAAARSTRSCRPHCTTSWYVRPVRQWGDSCLTDGTARH